MINITYSITYLQKIREAFDPKKVDVALDRAMQVAAMKTRTQISQKVRLLYNVKARDVAAEVKIRRLPGGRMLVYQGRNMPLDRFGMKQRIVKTASGRRIGATVLVKKSNGRKVVRGKFGQGGFPVYLHGWKLFERVPGTRMRGKNKEKIKRLFGPGIPAMVGNKDVMAEATVQAGEFAAIEFNRQMELLMGQPT